MAVSLLALLALVVGKLVWVQAFQHERFKTLAVNQIRHTIPLAATRGSILDRNGRDLALSIDRTTVYADPSLVEDPLGAARALAPVLGQSVKELQILLTKPGRFAYLARKVDDTVAKKVKSLHLPGIAWTDESARMRPASALASPLIGSVGVDNEGLGGLEHHFEDTLAGKPGSIIVDADRHMRRIASGEKIVNPSAAGQDLELTIDRGLQYEAERLLGAKIVETRSKGGIALVMDTRSGDVLAMANLRSPQPGGPVVQAERNTAVTDVYEPGSVNKLITLTGALEDNAIRVTDRFNVPDRMKVGNHVFSDHDPHPVVNWSPTDIMRESSNIGTIMIAQKLGKQRLADYLVAFGFGVKTGIEFPGESAGILRPASKWYSTDIGAIPIGQGVSVSALQMLAAYNAVANDGTYVAPRLVRATVDGEGVRHRAPDARTRRAVTAPTANAITGMLEEVVRAGTGTLAQIPGYRVAGKTGTARKPAAGGTGYIQGAYVSSFAGFAPADNPAITALVMLDEPTPIYGGIVAAPVFSDLARAVLRELRVPPSTTTTAATSAPGVAGEQITRDDGDVPVGVTSTTCCSQR
ncbi:MAG TPA: penicillin-binding protein 2 [Acidimicrobiales bacterium]|nr:penicillin-binding protein 2 [Acidimicrobiales bacterium]